MELTFFQPGAIVRGIDDGIVRGTALVYYDGTEGTQCTPYGDDTIERIAPGALDNVIKRGFNVIATYDHKVGNLLGRTPATLKLFPNVKGIDFELQLPTSAVKVRELLQRGDVTGCSFMAMPDKRKFSVENGKNVVTIQSFKSLVEISVVPIPHYTAAQIQRGKQFEEETYEQYQKDLDTMQRIAFARTLYK